MIKQGDSVVFRPHIIRMCGNSAEVAARRGVVISVEGAIAKVEFGKTWVSDDGRSIRSVPKNNLVREQFKGL